MDRERYEWRAAKHRNERYLVDKNTCNQIVAIVAEGRDEIIPGSEEEPSCWWGVYSPFHKKAVSQHLCEEDAIEYAETHIACGEREERPPWES